MKGHKFPDIPQADGFEQLWLALVLEKPTLLGEPFAPSEEAFTRYRRAYRALGEAWRAGTVVDSITAAKVITEAQGIPASKQFEWIEEALKIQALPTSVVQAIHDCAERRRWWATAYQLAAAASGEYGVTDDVLDELRQAIERPRIGARLRREAIDQVAHALVEEALAKQPGTIPGLATGFPDVDVLLGGIVRKDLTLLAARASVGKSACALQIATHQALEGAHVGLWSPEMRRRQSGFRLLSQLTGIASGDLMAAHLSPRDKSILRGVSPRLPRFWIVDEPAPTLALVGQVTRQAASQRPIDLLIFDQLSNSYECASARTPADLRIAIGRVTKALRTLAAQLDCAVLLLCQLNRQGEGEGKEMPWPSLGMLKDSGALEEDADTVVFLHRKTREDREAHVIVAKNRMGSLGKVPMEFDPPSTRFLEPRAAAAAWS